MTYSGEMKQAFKDIYLLWHHGPNWLTVSSSLLISEGSPSPTTGRQNPLRLAQCPAQEGNLLLVPRIEFAAQHLIMVSIDDAEFFELAEFCI